MVSLPLVAQLLLGGTKQFKLSVALKANLAEILFAMIIMRMKRKLEDG
jgi:hypothetical protein